VLVSLRPERGIGKTGPDGQATIEARQGALVAQLRASFWRRNRIWTALAGGLLLVLAVLAVVVNLMIHRAEPYLRARIVDALHDRFHARVELEAFHLSLVDGVRVEGNGLRIWPPAQVRGVDVAPSANPDDPLIHLQEFRFHAPLRYRPGTPFSIALVELKGLEIHIPPRSHFGKTSVATATTVAQPQKMDRLIRFAVGKITCNDAHLVLETSKPGKLPLDFTIAHFELSGMDGGPIRADSRMRFAAELTNPKPVGLIHSSGTIGPWSDADPGESPLAGDYQFDHADLASFKGIAGILSSTGKYAGTLRDLTVDGDTDTPDFRLTHFGNALPLHTHFHAKVDGTNGDTWLEPVNATLGHSSFTARGQVVRVLDRDPAAPGNFPVSKGHDIDLTVEMDAARIEDFLRLGGKSPDPLMTGSLAMKARLHIPPGPVPVHKRLEIKGAFNLDRVRFTSDQIQGRITELSLRGQGRPKDVKQADAGLTRSTMLGSFQMAGGVIRLPALTYTVPGATIQLKGAYGVEGGTLDFEGNARLQASLSKVVGGWAGFLLKPADRIFKKDGAGTEIPIHISGTRSDPKFGVDFGRIR